MVSHSLPIIIAKCCIKVWVRHFSVDKAETFYEFEAVLHESLAFVDVL